MTFLKVTVEIGAFLATVWVNSPTTVMFPVSIELLEMLAVCEELEIGTSTAEESGNERDEDDGTETSVPSTVTTEPSFNVIFPVSGLNVPMTFPFASRTVKSE